MSKKNKKPKKMKYKAYLRELEKLEIELVKFQGYFITTIQRQKLNIYPSVVLTKD